MRIITNAEDLASDINEKLGIHQTGDTEAKVCVIKVTSAGFNDGNMAEITINNEAVCLKNNGSRDNHRRGLHILIINPSNGNIEFGEIFDTYKSSDKFNKFISSHIPKGYVVAAACKDDCITRLSV